MSDCSCSSHGGFLTAKGLEEAAQREYAQIDLPGMGLTPREFAVRLDRVDSVSGLILPSLDFDDALLDEQYRRFHNGS